MCPKAQRAITETPVYIAVYTLSAQRHAYARASSENTGHQMAAKRKASPRRAKKPRAASAPAPATGGAGQAAPSAVQGATQSTVVGGDVAARGKVQKTFITAKVLSGFMDAAGVEAVIGEHLATLDGAARQAVMGAVDASRAHAATLAPFQPANVVLRPIQSPHTDAILADPLFQQSFRQRPHQFAYVDISQLVALQPWIEPRGDPIPVTETELLAFALPNNWDVPAEVSFIGPSGPIQILTSSPAMQGSIRAEFDAKNGTVTLGAPKHLNLVQVVHLAGRHYLLNGYHRVADAVRGGVKELPALVTEAIFGPQDINLGGVAFAPGYVLGLPRPPLVTDFSTPAAITAKVRERRYGVLVELNLKPLVIGI